MLPWLNMGASLTVPNKYLDLLAPSPEPRPNCEKDLARIGY